MTVPVNPKAALFIMLKYSLLNDMIGTLQIKALDSADPPSFLEHRGNFQIFKAKVFHYLSSALLLLSAMFLNAEGSVSLKKNKYSNNLFFPFIITSTGRQTQQLTGE